MYDIAFIGNGIKTECNSAAIAAEDLMQVTGQIGDFKLRAREADRSGTIRAKAIVVNAAPEEVLPVDGAVKFGEDAGPRSDTAVFIQDYMSLTPAYYNEIGLLHAMRVKKESGREVVYLYRSMRFPDGDSSLYKNARKLGVVFEKYLPEELKITRQGGFLIEFGSALLKFSTRTGSLFMAPLIGPGKSYGRVAEILRIKRNEEGFLQADNVYLQPTRTNRRGVYVIGFARGRNGMSSFDADLSFTLSDIRSETSPLRPLTGDLREVDEKACALCYTCFRSCPHGAVEKEESKACMKVDEYACYGCNTCISVCPAKAISIKNEVRKSPGGRPYKILLCENSAEIAYKELGCALDGRVEVMSVPCSNSVRKADIYRELSDMGGKLLVLGCINDSCRHMDGDIRFERVVAETKKNLSEAGLDPGRLQFARVSLRMKDRLKEIIDEFVGGTEDDCGPSKADKRDH